MDFDLERFLTAQRHVYEGVLGELRRGEKTGHWIWYVFPQLRGLGSSEMSWHYGIRSLEEARAYAAHPVLGARLRECASLLLDVRGRSAVDILGPIDAKKVRSSMTLFHRAVPGEPLFAKVLERYYGAGPDELTDRMLGRVEPGERGDSRDPPGDRGAVVFACIAPHGDLTIPEAVSIDTAALAGATQAGMAELARRFDAVDPDVVVVLTPHGIHVDGHFAAVVAGRAAGALEDAAAVALDLPVDRDLALGILAELAAAGLPGVGVSYGGNDPEGASMPLDWGSLIPLWHLGGWREPPRPVVIVSPARDLSPDSHVEAGRAIAKAVSASGRGAALVASCDQAHAHSADGPYGFDPAAKAYDEEVVSVLREGRFGAVRDFDPAMVAAAKPDAWWQMLMLLGAVGETWRPAVLSYEVPTYYGMLCAAFEPPAR